MQSTKNKLAQFNALRCEAMAKIDLLLLEERCPQHPDLPRFKFCPQRNSDDILFSLLDYATEEEILTRRTADENILNSDGTSVDGEGGQIQGSGAPNPDGASVDGEQTQDNGMPNSNETSSEGEESLISEVGNQDESPAQEGTVSSVVSSLQERATKKK